MSEMPSFEFLAAELAEKAKGLGNLGAKLKFVFTGHGVVHIDATGDKPVVTNDDTLPTDFTVRAELETWLGLRDKRISPPVALMTGKLKLEGNAVLATKLVPKIASVL